MLKETLKRALDADLAQGIKKEELLRQTREFHGENSETYRAVKEYLDRKEESHP